ncbi:MAG TPA: outer membrane lipoprotein-sorting protein [Gallionella sp.]|nr:outer membrane lipoprotein-sorting protein [Gallionella sp.]
MSKPALTAALLLLAAFAAPAHAADSSASALAATMRAARISEGFEARMNVATIKPDGRRLMPFKVAVIGQIGADRQRLLLRGIALDKPHSRSFAAERSADSAIRAIAYEQNSGITEADSLAPLFDSGLAIWDMFAPWWSWPRQELGGTDHVGGRECSVVKSFSGSANSAIREVASCVDTDAKISLRTQLFDRRHALVRTITASRLMRKDSGAMAAKKLSITEADNTLTEVEVYSGDEQYQITADTFAMLDSARRPARE